MCVIAVSTTAYLHCTTHKCCGYKRAFDGLVMYVCILVVYVCILVVYVCILVVYVCILVVYVYNIDVYTFQYLLLNVKIPYLVSLH